VNQMTWSRGDWIAFAALVVAILTLLAALLVVPEFRKLIGLDKAEGGKPARDYQQRPWYESNLLWGPLPVGVSVLLAVVTAMKHDVRWLLWFAAPCFILGFWTMVKHRVRGWSLPGSVMIAGFVIYMGVYWTNAWLGKSEIKEVESKAPTAIATNSSVSQQRLTGQQGGASTQGLQSATPTQPSVAQKKTPSVKPKKRTIQPVQQAALRESVRKQNATPAATTISLPPSSRGVIADGNIFENHPNALEVKDPGTTFTNNTVRNMDATIGNGARADNNDFEGRAATAQALQTQNDGNGASMEAIRKARTRNQVPGAYPDVPWPTANAVLHGSTSGVADQLAQFIDEAQKIAAEFMKDDNAQLIEEKESAWEAEVRVAVVSKSRGSLCSAI